MSKNLIKILSICAAALLLPLIIVGIVILTTQATGIKLKLDIKGAVTTAPAEVAIFIDNEKQEDTEIVFKRNTDVTITFDGEGYDFQGWYNGNREEVNLENNAVSDQASYSFTVRGNTTLTAVVNVKTYTVTYAGFMDDGQTAVNVNPATEQLNYGAPLKELEPINGKIFLGWYIAGTESPESVVSKAADKLGESGTYTLNPSWGESVTYTLNVKYYANYEEQTNNTTITYNTTTGFGEYSKTRSGYTFKGVEYNGITYNVEGDYNGLADVVIANANDEHKLDVTAVWECSYFDGFKLAIRTDTEDETTIWLDSEHQIDTDLDSREGYTTINFVDNNHENSYSLEQNVMTAYYNKVIREHVYAGWDGKFYDDNGNEVVWGGDFVLYISGNMFPVGGEGNSYHFENLIFERLMTLLASDNSYSNGLEGKTVTIVLMFN